MEGIGLPICKDGRVIIVFFSAITVDIKDNRGQLHERLFTVVVWPESYLKTV